MSGRMARNKGKRGEREVINLLQPIVDKVAAEVGVEAPKLMRGWGAARRGDHDVHGLEWLSLEVKRVENLSGLGSWWRQCCKQAGKGQTAVLLYRPNNVKWKVKMRVPVRIGGRGSTRHVLAPVTVDIETFLVYFEERVRVELTDRED